MTVVEPSDGTGCVCSECGFDFDFDLPAQVVSAASRGDLVLFAGAGVSTESRSVMPSSFYEECLAELPRSVTDEREFSFPEAMSAFEAEFGRRELVKALKKRFDYVDAFGTLAFSAKKFHRELGTMPYLTDIITTNWDTYFEEECAATPIVHGEDFAFSDLVGRKVYKIHGSITSLASLVATEDDYRQRLEELRNNALGGQLRTFLATKTIVFIGYSLRDWNFRELYDALLLDLGAFRPRAYVVSPFDSPAADELGLTHIRTSGAAFLRNLKSEMLDRCYLPDHIYERVEEALDEVVEAHLKVSEIPRSELPESIYCLSYQDGLMHAWGRVLRRRTSGEYSSLHHVQGLLHGYDGAADHHLAESNHFDAAYARGYCDSMMYLLVAADPSVLGEAEDEEVDTSDAVEALGSSDATKQVNSELTDEVEDQSVTSDSGERGEDDSEDAQEAIRPPCYLSYKTGETETFYDFEDYVEYLRDHANEDAEVIEKARTTIAGMTDDFVPNHTPFLHIPGHSGSGAAHSH